MRISDWSSDVCSSDLAVVIGGGLLGLEAAAGLAEQGMQVTVVHLMPTLMERQLDPAAGYLLKRAVEQRGIKVLTAANTKAIIGTNRSEERRVGKECVSTFISLVSPFP